jgi:hypothetical protein
VEGKKNVVNQNDEEEQLQGEGRKQDDEQFRPEYKECSRSSEDETGVKELAEREVDNVVSFDSTLSSRASNAAEDETGVKELAEREVDNIPNNVVSFNLTLSNHLVVVEIVDRDALPFAEIYLPGTTSKRKSHWVYRIQSEDGRGMLDPRKLTVGGGVILEVRPITFEERVNFPTAQKPVKKFELEVGIHMVLIATVLFKQWKLGDRRALALNVAKCFHSGGWTQGGVERLIKVVARQAGDDGIAGHMVAIQKALNATYNAGRSELVDCMSEESVTAMEASLSNLDELRDDLALDVLEFDFVPCDGLSGHRPFPPTFS